MTSDQPSRQHAFFRIKAFSAVSRILISLLLVFVFGCGRQGTEVAPEASTLETDKPTLAVTEPETAEMTPEPAEIVPSETVPSEPIDATVDDVIPRHDYVQPAPKGEGYPIAKFSATPVPSKLISVDWYGRLRYKPYNKQGDIIPDFSMAGYRRGLEEIPDVPVAETITANKDGSDEYQKIMDAVERIAQLPKDKKGFRGALLFKKGTYHISKPLVIDVDGVVLRGEGDDDNGTVLATFGPLIRMRTL